MNEQFEDRFGLTTLEPGQVTQNGTLFTFEMLIAYLSNPSFTRIQKLQQIERVKENFAMCVRQPGLLQRTPVSNEYDSMDNLTPVLAFSALFDNGKFARQMLEHGENTSYMKFYFGGQPKYFWNNQNPGQFCFHSWYHRSPGFISFLKLCAGKTPSLWDILCIIIMQFVMGVISYKSTDSWKLPYTAWFLLVRKGTLWRALYKVWVAFLKIGYKRGMKDVYAIYYQNPNHPIHKLTSEAFQYKRELI